MKADRRFIGIELKESYYDAAKRNLENALANRQKAMPLFCDDEPVDIRRAAEWGRAVSPVAEVVKPE